MITKKQAIKQIIKNCSLGKKEAKRAIKHSKNYKRDIEIICKMDLDNYYTNYIVMMIKTMNSF